jgi:hypothetical protein
LEQTLLANYTVSISSSPQESLVYVRPAQVYCLVWSCGIIHGTSEANKPVVDTRKASAFADRMNRNHFIDNGYPISF